MISFSGFRALVLSLVLLVETLPANAASAAPLPEEGDRRGGSKLKFLVVVVFGLIAGGAAYAYFLM